jgi:hypothetical protein
LLAWRNLFSPSGIFCSGRYQRDCIGIFWPAERTSQPPVYRLLEREFEIFRKTVNLAYILATSWKAMSKYDELRSSFCLSIWWIW